MQNLGWGLIGKGKCVFLIGDVSNYNIDELKKGFALMEETRDVANMLLSLSTLASIYLRKKEVIRTLSESDCIPAGMELSTAADDDA